MKVLKAMGMMMLVTSACTTTNSKVMLDSSPDKPSWVDTNKLSWEDSGKVFIKSTHSVKGNERLNGCYTLAGLNAKEALLSEISNDVKGSIDAAETSLSEDAEVVLGKVRSSEFSGKITGLKTSEQYFERYKIEDNERVDCYVLTEIKLSDYNKTKQAIINKVVAADPRIKEAITQKQIDFFSKSKEAAE